MEDLQAEQRMTSQKFESRKQVEKVILLELERIQKDIELAKQSSELHHLTAEELKKEVSNDPLISSLSDLHMSLANKNHFDLHFFL